MACNEKTARHAVRNAAHLRAFARLDAALVKNTHSVIAEYEKTQLWLLKIFGRAPETMEIQK
jgi:hypothetical protein